MMKKEDGFSFTPNPIFFTKNEYEQTTESLAVFGQSDFVLSEMFTLTAGVSFTPMKRKKLDLVGEAVSNPDRFFCGSRGTRRGQKPHGNWP